MTLQVFRFAADSTDVGNTSGGQAAARARVVDVRPLRYVARQPIFDRDEKVFGYELLFRDGLENAFHSDSNEASRATLDRTLLMGLDVLCDGRRVCKLHAGHADQRALIKQFGPWRCRMLAKKIEARAEFVRARDQGFVYFQGYFFRHPEMMNTRVCRQTG